MTFHLLERDRDGAQQIADALQQALRSVTNCERCNNFSETPICPICSSQRRDKSLLCIVEHPADLEAIENAGVFAGTYFVLMGRLSPLDGIGPQQLGLDKLERLLNVNEVKELIMATNLTVEGEATAHFVAELVSGRPLVVTRLARGVPVGGELEYMDHGTLEQAFDGRLSMDV
jgi:recombination protein RecR